jgi:hypothetical protein
MRTREVICMKWVTKSVIALVLRSCSAIANAMDRPKDFVVF